MVFGNTTKCHNPLQCWLPWLASTQIDLIQSPRGEIRHSRHVCAFELIHNGSGYKMGVLPHSQNPLSDHACVILLPFEEFSFAPKHIVEFTIFLYHTPP